MLLVKAIWSVILVSLETNMICGYGTRTAPPKRLTLNQGQYGQIEIIINQCDVHQFDKESKGIGQSNPVAGAKSERNALHSLHRQVFSPSSGSSGEINPEHADDNVTPFEDIVTRPPGANLKHSSFGNWHPAQYYDDTGAGSNPSAWFVRPSSFEDIKIRQVVDESLSQGSDETSTIDELESNETVGADYSYSTTEVESNDPGIDLSLLGLRKHNTVAHAQTGTESKDAVSNSESKTAALPTV